MDKTPIGIIMYPPLMIKSSSDKLSCFETWLAAVGNAAAVLAAPSVICKINDNNIVLVIFILTLK
jgi:hypothetical protein